MNDASGDDCTADDWAPLPSDDLCARPGEACDLVKKTPPPSAPPPAPVAPAPTTPRDLAAEEALAALKQKLAATAPATSLVATVQHREQRAERRRKAATAATACAETIVKTPDVVAPVPDEAPPAEPVQAAGDPDVDPRENEPWFRKLPHTERERLRARWWLGKHRHDGGGVVLRKRLQRAIGYGALCFFVLSLLQSLLMGSFALVPLLTVAGALAAGCAELSGGGRFAYAFAGAAAFVLVMGVEVLMQPLSLTGLMIAAYGMGTIGMDSEMRRSGGFREK